jgi:hypothetical protein
VAVSQNRLGSLWSEEAQAQDAREVGARDVGLSGKRLHGLRAATHSRRADQADRLHADPRLPRGPAHARGAHQDHGGTTETKASISSRAFLIGLKAASAFSIGWRMEGSCRFVSYEAEAVPQAWPSGSRFEPVPDQNFAFTRRHSHGANPAHPPTAGARAALGQPRSTHAARAASAAVRQPKMESLVEAG